MVCSRQDQLPLVSEEWDRLRVSAIFTEQRALCSLSGSHLPFSSSEVVWSEPCLYQIDLRLSRIDVDSVVQVQSGFPEVRFTPAVFMLDSHGVSQKAFLGKLNQSVEKRLLQLVASLNLRSVPVSVVRELVSRPGLEPGTR